MNRLVIFYGCALLASSAIAEVQQSQEDFNPEKMEIILNSTKALVSNDIEVPFALVEQLCIPCDGDKAQVNLDINDIEYVTEDNIELGFDTSNYLPENFDPYRTYFDVNSVDYVEDEYVVGFDTKAFLPEGFDPYSDIVSVEAINYMEEEFTLDFDTSKYLPAGFSPYEAYFNLDDIHYIDLDDLEEELSVSPWELIIKNEPYN